MEGKIQGGIDKKCPRDKEERGISKKKWVKNKDIKWGTRKLTAIIIVLSNMDTINNQVKYLYLHSKVKDLNPFDFQINLNIKDVI